FDLGERRIHVPAEPELAVLNLVVGPVFRIFLIEVHRMMHHRFPLRRRRGEIARRGRELRIAHAVLGRLRGICRESRHGEHDRQGYAHGYFSGSTVRMCSSFSWRCETSLGAFIIRSCACWFIGNMVTSRRFSSPAISMTMRSMPGAVPPCGGAPWRKALSMPANFTSVSSCG